MSKEDKTIVAVAIALLLLMVIDGYNKYVHITKLYYGCFFFFFLFLNFLIIIVAVDNAVVIVGIVLHYCFIPPYDCYYRWY